MDGQGSIGVPREDGPSGTVDMELHGTTLRMDVEARPSLRRFLGLQPQHLGYLSLVFDASLFLAAGVGAAVWLRLGHLKHVLGPEVTAPVRIFEGDMFDLAQVLSGTLLLLIFLGCCRYARLHEPLILLREGGWKAALRATACYALPPLSTLLAAWPALRGQDPVVTDFVVWLATFTAAAAVLALASRQACRL